MFSATKNGQKVELQGEELTTAIAKKFAEIDATKELSQDAKDRLKSEVFGTLVKTEEYN